MTGSLRWDVYVFTASRTRQSAPSRPAAAHRFAGQAGPAARQGLRPPAHCPPGLSPQSASSLLLFHSDHTRVGPTPLSFRSDHTHTSALLLFHSDHTHTHTQSASAQLPLSFRSHTRALVLESSRDFRRASIIVIVVLGDVKMDGDLVNKYEVVRDKLNEQHSEEQATHQNSEAQENNWVDYEYYIFTSLKKEGEEKSR